MNKQVIVVTGACKSGKTTLINRLKGEVFTIKYIPTLGVDILDDGVYQVRDTAGIGLYCGLLEGYYIGANSAIVMFRTAEQLLEANTYCKRLISVCGKDIKIILIANSKHRKVNQKNVERLISKYNIHKYIELDCKNLDMKLEDLL